MLQVVFDDVYMLDDEMKWKVLPPMPKPDSHIEFAWIVVNNSIVIVGGTTEKHPLTKKVTLVGEVFQFNLDTLAVFIYRLFFLDIANELALGVNTLVHNAYRDNKHLQFLILLL